MNEMTVFDTQSTENAEFDLQPRSNYQTKNVKPHAGQILVVIPSNMAARTDPCSK